MNTFTATFFAALLASAYAISDPAADRKTKKEMKRFLKDKLTGLSAQELQALGTENTEICTMIKDKEKYLEEKKDSFLRRLRLNLNASCVAQIAEENPKVVDAMFEDISAQGRRNFFDRLGAVKVCKDQDMFRKVDSKIKKSLAEYCDEEDSKKAIAGAEKDDKSAAAATVDTKAKGNSASFVQVSTFLVAAALVTGILI